MNAIDSWASEYFERGYAQRWGLPGVTEKIRQEVNSLWTRLGLGAGTRLVDLGCGRGRYALAFAGRGAQVVGIDSSDALLRGARSLGRELDLPAQWVRGDMRAVPLQSCLFDAVVTMDAFGFFEAEADNEQVLAETARLLRPGGHLILKVVNGVPILAAFRSTDHEERDGVVVTISRTLTDAPARMTEHLSVTGVRGNGDYVRRQRLYRPDEISAAMNRSGLEIRGLFADAMGAAFEPAASSTMWVIGERVCH